MRPTHTPTSPLGALALRLLVALGRSAAWFITGWPLCATICYFGAIAACFVASFLLAPIGIVLIALIPFLLLIRSIWELGKMPSGE